MTNDEKRVFFRVYGTRLGERTLIDLQAMLYAWSPYWLEQVIASLVSQGVLRDRPCVRSCARYSANNRVYSLTLLGAEVGLEMYAQGDYGIEG